ISPHPQPATTGFTLKEIEISPKKARLENKHNFFIDYPFDYGMMQSNGLVEPLQSNFGFLNITFEKSAPTQC
ncbi:MAG: hypothetical protein ACK5CM_21585, partial [Pseudanabaena sp.]